MPWHKKLAPTILILIKAKVTESGCVTEGFDIKNIDSSLLRAYDTWQ